MQMRSCRAVDDDIADAETDDLGHAGPGVVHQAEERPIPLARQRFLIRCFEDRLHLFA